MAVHKAKKKVAEAVWANQHKDTVEVQGLLLGELAEVVEGEEVVGASKVCQFELGFWRGQIYKVFSTKLLHSTSSSCAQYFYALHSATIL